MQYGMKWSLSRQTKGMIYASGKLGTYSTGDLLMVAKRGLAQLIFPTQRRAQAEHKWKLTVAE